MAGRKQLLGQREVLWAVGVEERIDARDRELDHAPAGSARSRGRSCARSSSTSARRSSSASATGQRPNTGWVRPPLAAQASSCRLARWRPAAAPTRSRGKNGVSVAIDDDPGAASGRCAAAHSSRSACPPSGPAKPGTTSATTGSPKAGEARRIAVGVEQQRRRPAGRARAITCAEQRPPAERPQALVAAAHAAGAARPPGGRRRRSSRPSLVPRRCPCARAAGPPRPRGAGRRRTRCAPHRTGPGTAGRARGRSASGSPRRASSTPQAVKPERETRIGMPICTVLITISEVSRPVV